MRVHLPILRSLVMCSTLLWTLARLASAAPAASSGTATATPVPGATIKGAARPATPPAGTLSKATFGMGCFWCAETAFESRDGVRSVVSGYSGGSTRKPTYEEVGAGGTGHAEVIQLEFDPRITSYQKMLDIFWHNVDPTQANGQFCDHGSQYRSVIFYRDASQKQEAEASKAKLQAAKILTRPIVTEITPFAAFYPAEDYHQDFWRKDPERYTSYRAGCGRDKRLQQIWGTLDTHAPNFH